MFPTYNARNTHYYSRKSQSILKMERPKQDKIQQENIKSWSPLFIFLRLCWSCLDYRELRSPYSSPLSLKHTLLLFEANSTTCSSFLQSCSSCPILLYWKWVSRAREISQLLRASSTEPVFIPRIYMAAHNHLNIVPQNPEV